jgi:peptidoglycan/xylan/chitin deacetylase (PgdA/CDA1 family)
MPHLARSGLRVLMYHRVAAAADALTVTAVQLEQQLGWLRAQGFTFVTLPQLMAAGDGRALPDWPVLVTFDDAYADTGEVAHPILERHGVHGTVFVPSAFIGQTSAWDRPAHPVMGADELAALVRAGWSVGLHSHQHQNYAELSPEAVAADVAENLAALRAAGIEPVAALAYPYGARPRGAKARAAMVRALQVAGIRLAFRIGNRVNRLPVAEPFDLNRLGIRGDESFGAFQRKVRWGRLF